LPKNGKRHSSSSATNGDEVMTIRNAADCEHGWHSVLTCPFCLRNQKQRLTEEKIKALEETVERKEALIEALKGTIAYLSDQVEHYKKHLGDLDETL